MTATISFNPYIQTVGAGLFNTKSTGLRQGTAYADPSTIFRLRSCLLASTETLPMWGGVGVYMDVPASPTGAPGYPSYTLGPTCGRATGLTGSYALAGFSVFDQEYGGIITPQSPVPLVGSYGQVMVYPLGSLARIAVQCDPNLIDLRGGPIAPQVSWDFQNQLLVPYATGTVSSGTYTSSSTVSSGTYNQATGAVSLTTSGSHGLIAGDSFTLSSMAGTGSITDLDGTFVATAGTTGSTLNFTTTAGLTLTITGGTLGTGSVALTTSSAHGLQPGDTFELSSMTGTNAATYLDGEWTAAAGTSGTTLNLLLASGLTLTITGGSFATGGLLPVKVLDVETTNCEVVEYNSATGFATWSYNGCCAVLQI